MPKTILITVCCGFIGQGFVGNAVYQKFSKYFDVRTYDIKKSKGNSKLEELLTYSEIIFLCLPTPMNSDGSCNTTIVETSLEKINKTKVKKIVVIKSTVPPGTTENYNKHFKNISIVFNPEFLTERNAVNDYENQNRIIIGGPRGVYDEAKRYLEALTIAYFKKHKLDVRIARIFNTYGPNMKKDDGRAIPNFINQLMKNDDITIYGNGSQTRSFCYIDDTLNGLYKLINSNYNYPVNIGNDNECSINDLVVTLKNIIKSSSKTKYLKLPENDPKIRKPDINLASEILDWNPKVNLEDGLKETISYFYNYK